MKNENEVPAGSVVINPIPDSQPEEAAQPATEQQQSETTAPVEDKPKANAGDDAVSRLEAMLKSSQSMIGKQSTEIGALRSKLDEMSKPAPGPSEEQVLNDLYEKMNSGDIDLAEGMRRALEINSNLTASRVLSQVSQQQQQAKAQEVQNSFLSKNPDYHEFVQSGVLQPYLDEDPMSDEYTAFHRYKADEKIKQVEAEYQQKVAAAKEEGAKLAKGSEAAGKVIGRQGASAIAPSQPNKPFKNTQEAQAAMLAKLQSLRNPS